MAELTLKSRIIFRKDTAANWSTKNPILKTGEPGWDSNNKRLKVGNGTLAWSNLEWAFPDINLYRDNGVFLNNISALSGSSSTLKVGDSGWYASNLVAANTVSLYAGNIVANWTNGGAFYSSSSTATLGGTYQPWGKIFIKEIESPINTSISSAIPDNFIISNRVNKSSQSSGTVRNTSIQLLAERYYVGSSGPTSDDKSLIFASAIGSEPSGSAAADAPATFYPSGDVQIGNLTSLFSRVWAKSFISANNTFAVNPNNSIVIGEDNYIGQNTFLVQSYSGTEFTLDSVAGIEVGDKISYGTTGTTYNEAATVTAINTSTRTITLSASPSLSSWTVPVSADNARACHQGFWITNKPNLGTHPLLFNSGTGTYDGSYQIVLGKNNRASSTTFESSPSNPTPSLLVGTELYNCPNSVYSDIGGRIIIGKYSPCNNPYPFSVANGTSDTNRKLCFFINPNGGITCNNISCTSITPTSSNSYSLGTTSYLWNYIYGNYGNFNTVYLNNSWATLPSDTNQRALLYKNYYNTSVGDIDAITTPGLYTLRTGITNGPYCSNAGSGGSQATSYFTVLCMATDNGSSYRPMIGIKENDNNLYVKGSTSGAWKRIGWGYGTAAPSGTGNTGDIYIQYES